MARSPRKPAGDWISVVEAGYSLDRDDSGWLARLLECIASEQWRDRSSAAFTFDLRPSGLAIKDVTVHGPPEIQDHLRCSLEVASPEALNEAYGTKSAAVGTVSELIFHLGDNKAKFDQVNAGFTTDVLRVAAHSGTGSGLGLTLLLDEVRGSTPNERRRWTYCAA